MTIRSDLLRSAIADAKAVRSTALANAKSSLEEAFAPRFEAMFAEKLKEEAEEEEQEESLDEIETPNQIDGPGEAKPSSGEQKTVYKGGKKPSTNKKSGKSFKPVQAGEGPEGVGKLHQPMMETTEEEDQNQQGQQMDEAGFTSEDLDEIIKELESEVDNTEEKGKRMVPPQGNGEDVDVQPTGDVSIDQSGGEDVNVNPNGQVDIDLDGNGENPEEEPEEPSTMNAGEVGEIPPSPEGEEVPAPQPDGEPEMGQVPPQFMKKKHSPEDEEEESINLEELLSALNEESEEEDEEKEEMDETMNNHGVPKNDLKGQDKGGGVKGYSKTTSNKWIESGGKNHNIQGKGNIGTPDGVGKPKMEETLSQTRVALKESYRTIEYLRGQINEVNLLNAKLLYTNKLFKEYAGVLDDSYRMKIVEHFDLTKSVREVKLAYALLAESLNFGTQVTNTNNNQKINQVLNKPSVSRNNSQVKQITEGFASKPVGSTKPSLIIVESDQRLRFKKLAGIKDAPKIISENKK